MDRPNEMLLQLMSDNLNDLLVRSRQFREAATELSVEAGEAREQIKRYLRENGGTVADFQKWVGPR